MVELVKIFVLMILDVFSNLTYSMIQWSVQGQVEWGFEQPGLVTGAPVPGRGVWNKMILKVPFNPNNSVVIKENWIYEK